MSDKPGTEASDMLSAVERRGLSDSPRHREVVRAIHEVWEPLLQATHDPRASQERALRRILDRNLSTRFAAERNLGSVKDLDDFRDCVACHDYEHFRPLIEEQEQSDDPVLTPEAPLMYARTSGTTGRHKLIPITNFELGQYWRFQRLLSSAQYCAAPEAFAGKSMAIVSPAVEGTLPSGRPFGSLPGAFYRKLPPYALDSTVLPASVMDIADYDTRYYVIARLAVASANVTSLSTANPSTLLRLATEIDKHHEKLIESVATGRMPELERLAASTRADIGAHIRADPERATELAALKRRGQLRFSGIWPGVRLVTTWTCGSCRIAVRELTETLPPGSRLFELGYVASEFRGTVTVDPEVPGGLPLLNEYLYEFAERDVWERGEDATLTLEELEIGRDYYVIVTTGSLYRYAIDDVVRVVGFKNRTPLLVFQQKGKGCTNITGEKLYESQVLLAVERLGVMAEDPCSFFLLIADEQTRDYQLLIEAAWPADSQSLSSQLDLLLSELNVEYCSKRRSGRLGPPRVRRLKPGTGEAFVRHCVSMGQREGQFKFIAVQYKRNVTFPFENYEVAV